MKNIQKVLLFACILFAINTSAQTVKTEKIKVYGNCGMCKSRIEKAAKNAGATSAVWNDETKILVVKFDAKKTDSKKIQTKVAAVGHDTQDATADKTAYDNLHECCQYERKTP
ncbi:MAG: heavy-metal-associated domain-containing protein [Chitinophagaceae bacterium]